MMQQFRPMAPYMPFSSMHHPSVQHYVGQGYPMQSPLHVSMQVSSNRNFQDFQYPKYAAIMQPSEEQMLQQQQYLPQQNDQQLQPQMNRAQLLDSATLPDWDKENNIVVDDNMPHPYQHGEASGSETAEGHEEQI